MNEHTAPTAVPKARRPIPLWLGALIVVLAAAVFIAAGFLLRAVTEGPRDSASAVERASTALQAKPGSTELRLQYAAALAAADRFDDARREYETILRTDPADTSALYGIGVTYAGQDRYKSAEAALWKVLEVDKTHALAARDLGDLYLSRKHYKSMLRAIEPALAAHPEMADLQYLAAVAYENLGRRADAIKHYRLTLRYIPDHVEARAALARLKAANR
jgi:tetratricopeptide (TPR) repeat protein